MVKKVTPVMIEDDNHRKVVYLESITNISKNFSFQGTKLGQYELIISTTDEPPYAYKFHDQEDRDVAYIQLKQLIESRNEKSENKE